MQPTIKDFQHALDNIEGFDLGILYDIADEVEINSECIDFLLKNLDFDNWHGVLAVTRGLARAENRLDEIIPRLQQLLSHDRILLVTLAVKAFSNFGEPAEAMLPDIFSIIKKNQKEKKNENDEKGAYENIPLVRTCVVAIANIAKLPEESAQILRDIVDYESLPMKKFDDSEVHDPRDLRAAACGALINFPTEIEASRKIWSKGVVCFGLEKIRAACFISLVETSFDQTKIRNIVFDMICNLEELKCGFSPEREAALYLERLLDFEEFGPEIIQRFLDPKSLWVTTEWNTSEPILHYFVESDEFKEKDTLDLLKAFKGRNQTVKYRAAMLLAHSKHCKTEIISAFEKKLEKQSDQVLDALAYAYGVLEVDPKPVQSEMDRRDSLPEKTDEENFVLRSFERVKEFFKS